MAQILHTMKKTSVETLIILSMVLSPLNSIAKDEKSDANTSAFKELLTGRSEEYGCRSLAADLKEAKELVKAACKDAGLGSGSSCEESALKCVNASSETPSADNNYNPLGTYLEIAGVKGGKELFDTKKSKSSKDLKNTCPHLSGVEWHERKKDLERDLTETEEDLAKLKEELADHQENYAKATEDAQEAMQKAQESLDELKNSLAEEKREKIAEQQQQQIDANKRMREMKLEKSERQARLLQSQQDLALRLIAMTDESGKRACVKAMNEAKKAYDLSSNASIADRKKKKADLIAVYSDCMDVFEQRREDLTKQKALEQDRLKAEMDNLDSDIAGIQDTLNLATTQNAEIQAEFSKKEQKALENTTKAMQLAQQKAQNAKSVFDTKQAALTEKQASLQRKLQRTNSNLSSLGPEPYTKDSVTTPGRAANDIYNATNDVLELEDEYVAKGCKTADPEKSKKFKDRAKRYKELTNPKKSGKK